MELLHTKQGLSDSARLPSLVLGEGAVARSGVERRGGISPHLQFNPEPVLIGGLRCKQNTVLTDIRKTLTPWSSVSMAVIRILFSLALSICI